MEILQELFLSNNRKLVDKELKKVIDENIIDIGLKENILYHLCLDQDSVTPSLEHSKRLRAYLCLLFAEEAGHKIDEVIPLATTLELLHNSTLIIDDIQDNDYQRCGKKALWQKVGIAGAINASYFLGLFAQSYFNSQREVFGFYDYTFLFKQTIIKLLSGQQKDICSIKNYNNLINTYFEISKGKTGALLNMACCFGSMPFKYNTYIGNLVENFTDLLSYAYQISDDISDLNSYMASGDKKLDFSNIIYYISERNIISDQDINEQIIGVIELQENLLTQLQSSIIELKKNNVIRTDRLDKLIKTIIKIK